MDDTAENDVSKIDGEKVEEESQVDEKGKENQSNISPINEDVEEEDPARSACVGMVSIANCVEGALSQEILFKFYTSKLLTQLKRSQRVLKKQSNRVIMA